MRITPYIICAGTLLSVAAVAADSRNTPMRVPDACTVDESAGAVAPLADLGDLYSEPGYVAAENNVQGTRGPGSVGFWDAATGKEIATNYPGQPDTDTLKLAVSADFAFEVWRDRQLPGSLYLWSARAHQRIADIAPSHDAIGPGPDAKFSPDGKRLALRTDARALKLLDGNTGARIFEQHFPEPIAEFQFTDGGRRLFAAAGNGYATIDAVTGRLIFQSLDEPGERVQGWYVDETGTRLAGIAARRVLVNAETGAVLYQTDNNWDPQFTKDGAFLFAAESGKTGSTTKIIDAKSGRVVAQFPALAGGWNVPSDFALAFSPDKRSLVARHPDGSASLVRLEDGYVLAALGTFFTEPGKDWPGYGEGDVPSQEIRFSRDGSRVFAAESNGAISLWDAHSGRRVARITGSGGSWKFRLTNDETRLVAQDGSGIVSIWDARSGRLIKQLANIGSNGFFSLLPNDNWLVTQPDYGEALLWDLRQLRIAAKLGFFDGTAAHLHVPAAPTATQFVIEDNDATALWDVTGAAPLAKFDANQGWTDWYEANNRWYFIRHNKDRSGPDEFWDASGNRIVASLGPANGLGEFHLARDDGKIWLTHQEISPDPFPYGSQIVRLWDGSTGGIVLSCRSRTMGAQLIETASGVRLITAEWADPTGKPVNFPGRHYTLWRIGSR